MAAAAVALGGALAVAPAAVAAPAAAKETAPASVLDTWQVYANYRTLSACQVEGKRLLNAGFIDGWRCEWDSPYYALWVKY
jgi:hypothetical protein